MSGLSKDYETVLEELNAIHAAKSRKRHPLWVSLVTGRLSRPQVQEFLKQFSVIPLYNHFYHGPLYVNCPSPKWRQRLAAVIYEEGAGGLYANGIPHFELYLRLGEAFGVSREDMYNVKLCGGSIAVRNFYENVSRRSFLEGYAASSLGGEAQVPGVAGKVSEAFIKHYGLTPEQALFYSVHEIADTDHSSGGLEFLRDFAPTDIEVELVVSSVRDAVEVMWTLYQDIWSRVEALADRAVRPPLGT